MWPFISRPEVGCLGKLPCAADFSVQQPLGLPAEETFASWLHLIPGAGGSTERAAPGENTAAKTAEKTGEKTEAKTGEGSSGFDFLATEPEGRGAIAGRLWPSSDSAGRAFPFALYRGIQRRDLKPDLAAMLPRLATVWDALDGLARQSGRPWTEGGADIAAVRAAIRGAKAALAEPEAARGDARGFREREPWPILAAIFPQRGPAEIAAALVRFGRFLDNFAAPERAAVALRVPRSAELSASEQVLFWAAWMEARLGRPAPLPRLYLQGHGLQGHGLQGRGEEAAKGLWFLYRAPLVQDAEVLFHGRATHEYICDLAQAGCATDSALDPSQLPERLAAFRTCGELFDAALRPDLAPGVPR